MTCPECKSGLYAFVHVGTDASKVDKGEIILTYHCHRCGVDYSIRYNTSGGIWLREQNYKVVQGL